MEDFALGAKRHSDYNVCVYGHSATLSVEQLRKSDFLVAALDFCDGGECAVMEDGDAIPSI
eukprot:50583-Rhodomonas_salina.2